MKYITLAALIISISGCASGVQKLRKIEPGMSSAEVNEIMGQRNGFKTAEKNGSSFVLYEYTNQLCNGHISIHEKCDFFVVFKDGKVIETGTKNVRANAPQMTYISIFNR